MNPTELPRHREKQDSIYIRKRAEPEPSFWGAIKWVLGAILWIFIAVLGLPFAIFFILMVLHYTIIKPLLDIFAG